MYVKNNFEKIAHPPFMAQNSRVESIEQWILASWLVRVQPIMYKTLSYNYQCSFLFLVFC
jgi:hypothetical protein